MAEYVKKGNKGLKTYMEGLKMADEKKNTPDYDVSSPVKTGEKVYWQRIGSAWTKEKGISIALNAHPMGDSLFLFPHKEKKE